MKNLLCALLFISCAAGIPKEKDMETTTTQVKSIYDFKLPSIDGGTLDLSSYKGKKILIVNTASECGYTPQYEGLEKLYEQYKEKLVVIGIPSNDFGGQEPGSNDEIVKFCKVKFGTTFPLAAKMEVSGSNRHPLYNWLTQKTENGVLDAEVKWNFTKFLLSEEGKLIAYFPSKIEPLSDEIVTYLK